MSYYSKRQFQTSSGHNGHETRQTDVSMMTSHPVNDLIDARPHLQHIYTDNAVNSLIMKYILVVLWCVCRLVRAFVRYWHVRLLHDWFDAPLKMPLIKTLNELILKMNFFHLNKKRNAGRISHRNNLIDIHKNPMLFFFISIIKTRNEIVKIVSDILESESLLNPPPFHLLSSLKFKPYM